MVHIHHLAQKVKKNLVMLFLHMALHDIIDINKNFNFSESKKLPRRKPLDSKDLLYKDAAREFLEQSCPMSAAINILN